MNSNIEKIDSYISFLNNKLIKEEVIGFGWYRDLHRNNRIGNVATAQIILVYTDTNNEIPHKESIFTNLYNKRLPDGSWSFISNIDEVGVIDATAWVLLALLSNQSKYKHYSFLEESYNWLLKIQNNDGGWGIIEGASSRIVSTAFAVRALLAANNSRHDSAIKKALSYLIDNQHTESYWKNACGKPCVGATSHAIFALSNFSIDYSLQINRAANWLINSCNRNPRDFWDHNNSHEEVEVTIRNKITRINYDFPLTPLAIRALRLSGLSKTNYTDIIEDYITELEVNRDFKGTRTLSGYDTSYGIHDIVMSIRDTSLKTPYIVETKIFDLAELEKDINAAEFPKLFLVARLKKNNSSSNTINLLFFHGLGGHPSETWLNKDSKFFLPIGLSSEDTPNLNIYTLGYENSPSEWLGSAMSLNDRTTNIIQLIENENFTEGKIVLVGHSFGGLLIKSIITTIHSSESKNAPIKTILEKIAGICFIATPHSGSELADFFMQLPSIARMTEAIKDLESNKPELIRLNNQYKTIANDLGIKHILFSETKKTKVFCRGIKEIFAFKVVNKESAGLGFPGERIVPLDGNHIEISKPKSSDSLLVRSLQKFLRELNN